MGNICSSSPSQELTPAEYAALQAENSLQLGQVPIMGLLAAVPENLDEVSPHQWLQNADLSLNTKSILEGFLELADSSKTLKTALILLGKGTPHLKTALLYQTFNENSFMSPLETKQMLLAIGTISAKLVLLSSTDEERTTYYYDLQQGMDKFIIAYNSRFHDTNTLLYAKEFHGKFQTMKQLLLPTQVRRSLLKFSNENTDYAGEFPTYYSTINWRDTLDEESRTVCSAGHKFEWTNAFFIPTQPKFMCETCTQTFTGPAWFCSQCNTQRCEACIDCPAPKLTCVEDHLLIYRPDVADFYKRLYNTAYFNCEFCSGQFQTGAWQCRSCKYDVCVACAEVKGYFLLKDEVECASHELHPGQPCCMCLNSTFTCRECGFCEQCFAKYRGPSYSHAGFQCSQGHLFKWTECEQTCFACALNAKGYSCPKCDICLCADCAAPVIDSLYSMSAEVSPSATHWEPLNPCVNCSKCNKPCSSLGCFVSNDSGVCIRCTSRLTHVKNNIILH